MQYDVDTVSAYLDLLEDDWRRETLESLRTLIKSKAPDIVEGINYKMLSYGNGSDNVFHLNVQKHYVSLYVANIKKIDPDGTLLKGIETGKGCIRLKKSVTVENTGIGDFIGLALVKWERGDDDI